jgi:hypothetical protein
VPCSRDVAMPLSPPTDDGDDYDATRGGGGDDKGQASGDDSPSRHDALELEAWWWRGLVI